MRPLSDLTQGLAVSIESNLEGIEPDADLVLTLLQGYLAGTTNQRIKGTGFAASIARTGKQNHYAGGVPAGFEFLYQDQILFRHK